MKTVITTAAAALLAISFASTAGAATKKDAATAQHEAACKEQAAKKYSAIHFLARRDFVKQCMGQVATKKAPAKKANQT